MNETKKIYTTSQYYWQAIETVLNGDASAYILRRANTRTTFIWNTTEGKKIIIKYWLPFKQPLLKFKTKNSMQQELQMINLAAKNNLAQCIPIHHAQRKTNKRIEELLVLPYIKHQFTLEALLTNSNSTNTIAQLITKAGEKLAELHQANIIHNDYKADNILVVKNNNSTLALSIIDWGESCHTTNKQQHLMDMTIFYKRLLRTQHLQQYIINFLNGYKQKSPWFKNNYQHLNNKLKKIVAKQIAKSNRRTWRRAFRKKNFFQEKTLPYGKLILLPQIDMQEALQTLQGNAGEYKLLQSKNANIWRATNVYVAMKTPPPIIGVLIQTSFLGLKKYSYLYKTNQQKIDTTTLIKTAKKLC